MSKKNKKARQKYLDFLKEKIKEYCTADGFYQIYWDYRDDVSADMLLNAYREYSSKGYDNIEQYLTDTLYELNLDYDTFLFEQIKSDIYETDDIDIINEYNNTDNIYDDAIQVGYSGIDVNLNDLLKNTRIKVNIMFATDCERNYDMGSIVTSYGNDYQSSFVNWSCNKEDFDNALTYFIHQQGHTVKEVMDFLFDNPRGFGSNEEMSFAKSIVNDIVNNSSDAMSELTALVELSGNDILEFFNQADRSEGYLVLSEDTNIGIFNEWSGCGGLLEFQLDKPFIVPTNMIRNIQIEGAGKENYGYTVNEVYGLVGSCWKDTVSYTDKRPELKQENIQETINAVESFIQQNKEEVEICD